MTDPQKTRDWRLSQCGQGCAAELPDDEEDEDDDEPEWMLGGPLLSLVAMWRSIFNTIKAKWHG